MRKINYRENILIPRTETKGAHYELQEKGEAIFHCFGSAADEYGAYPVAIIECPDGEVKVVRAEHIGFVK